MLANGVSHITSHDFLLIIVTIALIVISVTMVYLVYSQKINEKLEEKNKKKNAYNEMIELKELSKKLENISPTNNANLTKYEEDQRDPSSLITKISYCYTRKTLYLPVLYEGLIKKDPWMTVEPYEILTHNTRAKYVKGNVLLLGCGLGYTAFRL